MGSLRSPLLRGRTLFSMYRGFESCFIRYEKGAARAPFSYLAVQYHLPPKHAFHRLRSETAGRRGFEPLQRTGRRGPSEPRALFRTRAPGPPSAPTGQSQGTPECHLTRVEPTPTIGRCAHLRGVPADLPAVRGRDADHRLHHQACRRSGHSGAHRRTRHPAPYRPGAGSAGVVRGRYGACHRCRGRFRWRSLRPARTGVRVRVRVRPAGVLVKQPSWAAGPAVARFPETHLSPTGKSVSPPPGGPISAA
jgi:hypothetical protein